MRGEGLWAGEQWQHMALGRTRFSVLVNIGASQIDFSSAAMAVKGLIVLARNEQADFLGTCRLSQVSLAFSGN